MAAPNPSFDPQQILSLQTLYQILIGSAVVTTVINVVWFVISSILSAVARRTRLRVKSHVFVLGNSITRKDYNELSRDIAGFYCLLVRYGTDEYLTKMASEQERFEGRQRLKLVPIRVAFNEEARALFTLKLPVHKSLGTQFKCFAEARSIEQVPIVVERLQKCEHASDVKQSDSYHRERVFFLLDQFIAIDTIQPGVRNNYIFPE